MIKFKKEEIYNFMKKNRILFVFGFVSIFLVVLFLNRGTYSVDEVDSLVINCPDSINGGGILECSIELNSVSIKTQGVSSKYKVTDGMEYVSFVYNNAWKDYANNEYGFVLVSNENTEITGKNVIGTLKYKVPANALSNSIYKVELINTQIGDGEDTILDFNNVYDEVRIISNVNTLEGIKLNNGNINEVFDKNKKEYTANIDNDKVVIDVVKTDNNSVVSGDVGELNLHYGTNVFNIDVISETGVKNTYKLSIYRGYAFSSDKYVYNKENNYLYTYNDVDNEVILNNINIAEGLGKKIENNKLIISYNNENLLEINILNVIFKNISINDKVLNVVGDTSLESFNNNIILSDNLTYKVFNNGSEIGATEVLLDNMQLKVYYSDIELDSYSIKVIPYSLSFNEILDVDSENKYINSLNTSMSVTKLLENINVVGGSVILKNNKGEEKTGDAIIGTGDKIYIYDKNGLRDEYTLSVIADLNGDGKTNINDIIRLSNHILNINILSGKEFITAGDINNNGKIDINDIIKLATKIMNGEL